MQLFRRPNDAATRAWVCRLRRGMCAWVFLGSTILSPFLTRAEVQFDMFIGYGQGANDGVVSEAAWFPVIFELKNDGPTFQGIVELTGGHFGRGQMRWTEVELPTHTRKRVLVPVYCTSAYGLTLEARLRDASGRVRAELLQRKPRLQTDWLNTVVGVLPRTHAGAPAFPESRRNDPQTLPVAARLSADLFPENPLVLDGLDAVYLHSAKALELNSGQAQAILAWVFSGGHLLLAVEQPGDLNATRWLTEILPCEVTGLSAQSSHPELQEWLATAFSSTVSARGSRSSVENPFNNLRPDAAFEAAPLPVATARMRDGAVTLGSPEKPLMVSAVRGRGRVTVLLFSPELEPFRSWNNRAWFWARLFEVPWDRLSANPPVRHGGYHTDAVFGAMIDSRQIRKLPVFWLLMLLVVYLAVIGPVDYVVLKRLNRQMLTWITFPLYVVLFSLLIYFIGYKLRAGEIEYNELQLIDLVPHGERVDFRGHSYGSVYSPANASYPVACPQPFAAFRGEQDYSGGQEVSKATVRQHGHNCSGRMEVPVWTSQLYCSEWWRQGRSPLNVQVQPRDKGWTVEVQNLTGKSVAHLRLVVGGYLFELGALTNALAVTVDPQKGRPLSDVMQQLTRGLPEVANRRRRQWGDEQAGRLEDKLAGLTAVSFLHWNRGIQTNLFQHRPGMVPFTGWGNFMPSPTLDMAEVISRGDAVLLAWLPGTAWEQPMNRFEPRYNRNDTLFRVVVPVQ